MRFVFSLGAFGVTLLSLILFTCPSYAEIAKNWTNPNGKLPSFTESYTVGEQIIISWMPLNDSLNDLWVTRYDPSVDDFSLRLTSMFNISTPASYKWTIAVGEEDVMKDTRFMFQWLPGGVPYDSKQPAELASPGFNLLIVNQQTPPNGTATPSTASSTSSTSSIASSSTNTVSTSSAVPGAKGAEGSVSSTEMSTGAKAGVAVAVVVLVLGSSLAAFILWKRRHRKTIDIANNAEEKSTGPYEMLGDRQQPIELNPKDTLYELNDSQSVLNSPSELPPNTILKRPGLHELAS